MNFDLGPDELALRDGIRELCRKRFPIERVREGFDRDGWRALGEAGVFGLRLPEDHGGVGLGLTEAAIVFQELGRALVAGPLLASHMGAGHVDGAATGECVTGFAFAGDDLVEHFADLDTILLVGSHVWALRPVGLEARPADPPLDPLTPVHRVHLPDEGEIVPLEVDRFFLEARTLTAALLVGNALVTTELAVAYAKDREQFGRPIGSFQAVKHLCADMLVRAEIARAATDAAAVLLDGAGEGDVERAVASAKLLAGEAAIANGKACIQVHGGMGFTWEGDPHLYLKRAVVLTASFGGVDAQAEAVAASL
jgi:alkylation response protein AidB-like acyl-CoA dehydrogenase